MSNQKVTWKRYVFINQLKKNKMKQLSQPLTNVQIELLKVFSYDLDNEELLDLKDVLAKFFAQRAIKAADEVWEKEKWTEEDVDRILKTKLRKSKV